MSGEESDVSIELAQEISAQVRLVFDYFHTKSEYRYERILGKGAWGVVCLLEKVVDGKVLGKFAVKRGTSDVGVAKVGREAFLLPLFDGATHIVQRTELAGIKDIESRLPGPTLMTEYLQNGSLGRLINRIEGNAVRVPNRLLWRIFLCMIKMCIALAYPPKYPGNEHLEGLSFPDGETQLAEIVHGDMHSDNVMFGDFSPPEHDLAPILKLFDFGEAQIFDLENQAEEEIHKKKPFEETNIFEMGKLMLDVIIKRDSGIMYDDDPRKFKYGDGECDTLAVPLFQKKGSRFRDQNLDTDLATLVARCLANFKFDQPSLEELYRRAVHAVRTRTSETYHHQDKEAETDENIREFVQSVLLEPDFIGDRFNDFEIPAAEIKE